MPRKSQWDGNDAMWAWVAKMHAGGMSYSKIHGQLAVKMRAEFGLEAIPSEDTLRYNVTHRGLLEKKASPLPDNELVDHHRSIAYLGKILRRNITPPTNKYIRDNLRLSSSMTFNGFEAEFGNAPESKSEAEEEIWDGWDADSDRPSSPESFDQYLYFREHMGCTLIGRKVLNGLDAVERTSGQYNTERIKLLDLVTASVESRLPKLDRAAKKRMKGVVFRSIEPTEKAPRGYQKLLGNLFDSDPELKLIAHELLTEFHSSKSNLKLSQALRLLGTAQKNLKAALTPEVLITKMVRDSECEICSAKPLERAV